MPSRVSLRHIYNNVSFILLFRHTIMFSFFLAKSLKYILSPTINFNFPSGTCDFGYVHVKGLLHDDEQKKNILPK
jgi:hypothetical protein